jgi:hypothetical protein
MTAGLPSAEALRGRLAILLLSDHFSQAGNWLDVIKLIKSQPPMYFIKCAPDSAHALARELHCLTGQLFSPSQTSWVLCEREVHVNYASHRRNWESATPVVRIIGRRIPAYATLCMDVRLTCVLGGHVRQRQDVMSSAA